jgi:hypothetical protein
VALHPGWVACSRTAGAASDRALNPAIGRIMTLITALQVLLGGVAVIALAAVAVAAGAIPALLA